MQSLEGLTVVTLEHAIAAPFATRQLADLGARVIKIERPGIGPATCVLSEPDLLNLHGWALQVRSTSPQLATFPRPVFEHGQCRAADYWAKRAFARCNFAGGPQPAQRAPPTSSVNWMRNRS